MIGSGHIVEMSQKWVDVVGPPENWRTEQVGKMQHAIQSFYKETIGDLNDYMINWVTTMDREPNEHHSYEYYEHVIPVTWVLKVTAYLMKR